MWLYNLYMPSLHDELGHPRIWIGMYAIIQVTQQSLHQLAVRFVVVDDRPLTNYAVV